MGRVRRKGKKGEKKMYERNLIENWGDQCSIMRNNHAILKEINFKVRHNKRIIYNKMH